MEISTGNEDTDFDSKGLGMWRDVGQIKWKRNKGFTQTMNTGPNGDHTTGKGTKNYCSPRHTCFL